MDQPGVLETQQGFALSANEVHVWTVDLKSCRFDEFRTVLSPDELQKSERYRFTKDRHSFIARRFARRRILSNYVRLSPETLTFESSELGKPRLAGLHATSTVEFSTSSSRDLAVIAVSNSVPVGIDVEFLDEQFDFMSVAANFFSDADVHTIRNLSYPSQCTAFYTIWTRTEALGKANGNGLSNEVQRTGPDGDSLPQDSIVHESIASRAGGKWWFLPLELRVPGYLATLCSGTEKCLVRYFEFK